MKKTYALLGISLFLFLAGCSSAPMLRMEAQRAPFDDSVLAPSLTPGKYKKIMVIPPSGTVRGQYDILIALFEREFLRNGITVISGAITGRVVLEASSDKRVDSGSSLSDAERALIMAKKSGADAILQIGEWNWSRDMSPRRFFIYSEFLEKGYREVNSPEFQAYEGLKYAFPSTELRFVGRLTNTENGEVIASFEIKSPSNFNLPSRYVATMDVANDRPFAQRENFAYGNNQWVAEAQKVTEGVVIKLVCNRILRTDAVSGGESTAPPPAKVEAARPPASIPAPAPAPVLPKKAPASVKPIAHGNTEAKEDADEDDKDDKK